MMFRSAVVAVFAVCATTVAASGGIAGTVSAAGVNYVIAQLLPGVVQQLDKTPIPDQTGSVRCVRVTRAVFSISP